MNASYLRYGTPQALEESLARSYSIYNGKNSLLVVYPGSHGIPASQHLSHLTSFGAKAIDIETISPKGLLEANPGFGSLNEIPAKYSEHEVIATIIIQRFWKSRMAKLQDARAHGENPNTKIMTSLIALLARESTRHLTLRQTLEMRYTLVTSGYRLRCEANTIGIALGELQMQLRNRLHRRMSVQEIEDLDSISERIYIINSKFHKIKSCISDARLIEQVTRGDTVELKDTLSTLAVEFREIEQEVKSVAESVADK